jgi:CRISPR/Cas system CSM-associated protein Csm3 (group 7 of RAMP superfamily)
MNEDFFIEIPVRNAIDRVASHEVGLTIIEECLADA